MAEDRPPTRGGALALDPTLEQAKERAWRRVAEIDAAHARGEFDDAGWYRAMAALIVPSYLGASDERGGSGHTGTASDWEWSRGVVDDAIDRGGTFLDVGCANGLLMQSVARWSAARGLAIDPYGLDIAPELVALARRRLPAAWSDRIFVGNALGFVPPRQFDWVRTGLEYVPRPQRCALVAWLLERVVAPGGRLIVGKYNEEIGSRAVEHQLRSWGFAVVRAVERAHRTEPRIAYRAVVVAS